MFDVVDAVIFVVALDSFDERVEEAPEKNMLEDSLELFDEVLSTSGVLKNKPLVLILNKVPRFPRPHTTSCDLSDPRRARSSTASSASSAASRSGGGATRGSTRSRGSR